MVGLVPSRDAGWWETWGGGWGRESWPVEVALGGLVEVAWGGLVLGGGLLPGDRQGYGQGQDSGQHEGDC